MHGYNSDKKWSDTVSINTEYELNEQLKDFNALCDQHTAKLRAFQAFWREAITYNIDIPYDAYYGTHHYHNIAQFSDTYDNELNAYPLDTEATQVQLARVVKWAKRHGWKVIKKYTDDEFTIRVEGIHEPIEYMEFYSTRKVVCTRVQTGTKIVPATEEKIEPVYEYVCDKIAFLNVNTD